MKTILGIGLAVCVLAQLAAGEEPPPVRPSEPLKTEADSKAGKKASAAQALAAAEEAVQANPGSARAHLDVAILCGRLAALESPRRQIEMSRRIREEAEEAVRLDPGLDEGWYVLGRWHYELASLNPVLKTLAQAIYGKLPDASYAQALLAFEKAVALNPDNASLHIELGRTWLAVGEKEKARRELEKGLSLPGRGSDDEDARQRARKALRSL